MKSRKESATDPEGGRPQVTHGVANAGLAEPHLGTNCSTFTSNRIFSDTKQTVRCQLTKHLCLEDSIAQGEASVLSGNL